MMSTSVPQDFSLNSVDDDHRFLSRELCHNLFDRVFSFANSKYKVVTQITSSWEGDIRWARNRTSLASNRRRIRIRITLGHQDHRIGEVATNQLDDVSLKAAVQAAERLLDMKGGAHIIQDLSLKAPELTPPEVTIWSDATYSTTNAMRGELARMLIESAEQHEMLSAGYIKMRAGQIAAKSRDLNGHIHGRYDRYTNAECTMTVRHPQGLGSGWAGMSSYDWAAIDGPALASRALDKCLKSLNPVRIEPGRYTVILESQAVYQLVKPMIDSAARLTPERGRGPYPLNRDAALGLWRSKLGLKIVDERITIRHSPSDPEMGVIPVSYTFKFEPVLPITWIERGVLTALAYNRSYALEKLNENLPLLQRPGFYMDGGDSSIEEMIATTKRGLLVTRFSDDIETLDLNSLLMTGITRDGLLLIENGTITKAVHNFRFTGSPLFVLNQVELLGKPMPVYTGSDIPAPAFVPPIKANDFSFTALVDAI
jgi:predicted Zn-dependent protease